MQYKGFSAKVEYSIEDGLIVGHIADIRDIVGFHGESVTELRSAFEAAVDDYLVARKKLGLDARDVDAGDKARIKNIHDGEECPMCRQGILRDSTKNITTVYKGHSFTSQSRGAFCDNCEDGFVEYDELEEALWRQFRDNVDA